MAGPKTVTASSPVFLHLQYLIFQHTLNFLAHGFGAGLTEMNPHNIGGRPGLFCKLFPQPAIKRFHYHTHSL